MSEVLDRVLASKVIDDGLSRREMQDLLTNEVLLGALHRVLEEADDRSRALATVSLEDEAGLAKARRTQGEIYGLKRAVDIILEMADDGEDDGNEDSRHSSEP